MLLYVYFLIALVLSIKCNLFTFRAIYGYANNTNDLKLVSKGNGGLDELADQLDESKILYAFARVVDPNTGLTKFVLINWVSLLHF